MTRRAPHNVGLLPTWLTDDVCPQFLRSGLLPTFSSVERVAPA